MITSSQDCCSGIKLHSWW